MEHVKSLEGMAHIA